LSISCEVLERGFAGLFAGRRSELIWGMGDMGQAITN
jgi:hypothetical protein